MRAKTALLLVLPMLAAFVSADLAYKTVAVKGFEKGKWDVKASYIQFKGNSPLAAKANVSMRTAAEKRLAKFLKDSRQLQKEFHENRPYSYDETPKVGLARDGLIAVVTDVGSYQGGAHPYNYPVFDNWGLVGGKPVRLRLQDLLVRRQKDVVAVSMLVMGKLAKIERAAWVQEGTVRELDKNTEDSFTITPKGLHFIFAAYVMGPYSSGPIDVELSWSELRGLADPNGPLKAVMGKR